MPRSLAYTHRKIARQWHSTRNGDLTPRDVTAGSGKRVWWRCAEDPDHEWQTMVVNRTLHGSGCPFCSGRRATRANCLARIYPQIAAQWHPTRNGWLTPADVTPKSARTVWWKCHRAPDHEWQAPVQVRTIRGRSGCPFCLGRRLTRTNTLAYTHPEIAAEWHSTRNAGVKPSDVYVRSRQRVWWQCSRDPAHVWETEVRFRTHRGTGCPFCAGKRPSPTNSLASLYPEIAAEWHPTRNGGLKPFDVPAGSHKRVWWRCRHRRDHEWETSVKNRTRYGNGCPFCSGRRASPGNCLASSHRAMAAQWHPTRNGELTPRDVTPSSGRRVWWKCNQGPDHEWQTSVDSRVQDNTGCPFCAGRRVSVTNSLANLHPGLAAQWHPTRNGDLTPRDVVAGSGKRAWWKCPRGPDHEWHTTVQRRTLKDSGCPFCAGRRVSVTNCLKTLFPKVAKEWHPKRNGKLTPRQALAASKMPVWWRCRRGHVWRATIHNRTVKGRGCPACAAGQTG